MQALMASLVVTSHLAVMGATPVQPKWNPDYGKALEAARSAKRPLVVLIENPKLPQQALDKNALLKVADSNELLAKYELCLIDATTEVGKQVAKAFGATKLPYTAVTDAKAQKVVYRGAGQRLHLPKQWIAMLAARRLPRPNAFKLAIPGRRLDLATDFISTTPASPAMCFT